MVTQLQKIHSRNFVAASEAIGNYQAKYKEQYDKKHNVQAINWKIGDKVQYARHASKKPKSKSALSRWSPFRSYYEIYKVNLRGPISTPSILRKNWIKNFSFPCFLANSSAATKKKAKSNVSGSLFKS